MRLNKDFFLSNQQISFLGDGELGGKASGLEFINSILETKIDKEKFAEFEINIPKMIVIKTDVFDDFMRMNKLWNVVFSDKPDDRIALAFQKADLPFNILGDLRMIVNEIKLPLAIRSSSVLEDAINEPFAGTYKTKMIPNNQPDVDTRFRKLVEAIKYVYASTYFKASKKYINATKHEIEDEKMGVIIQEIVGNVCGEEFYPAISGVARSYNYYPTGGAHPEDGVVNLAFGLGKTIVDGGVSWAYTPMFPKIDPLFKSRKEMLKHTQLKYWSVNMGKPAEYNPIKETEYMFENHFMDADNDVTLKKIVSTYDVKNDRIWMGQSGEGPQILTFAPVLKTSIFPLNELVKELMKISEEVLTVPVEIEFAVTFPQNKGERYRFGFLQVRPMVVSSEEVEIHKNDMFGENILVSSSMVLGNGSISNIKDIIYVKPEMFNVKSTNVIANEIEQIDLKLGNENKQYLLIGFGRWGTTDPWAGIPVDWSQIASAKVIVEAAMENMNQEMSQASHFFHNVTSFKVCYFSVPNDGNSEINWQRLSEMIVVEETEFLKHVVCENPLSIKADGRTGIGLIKVGGLEN